MYLVLGAAPGASEAELKAAYEARLAALDREEAANPSTAAQDSVRAARSRLEEAWEILSDPKQRLHYDLMLAMEPAPASPAPAAGADASAPVPAPVHHDHPIAPVADPTTPPPTHHLPPPPPPPDLRRPPHRGECQLCGSAPAAELKFRRETGLILVRQRRLVEGTYCRDCGLSLFRETTDKTLMTGWWGFISFFANWITIVSNVAGRVAIRSLGPPVPNSGVRAPLPGPLDPGKPLFRRFGPYVVILIAFAVFALFAFAGDPEPRLEAGKEVGSCLDLSSDLQRIDDVVSCDGDHDATITSVLPLDQACPSNTIRFQDEQRAFCLTLS